MNPKRAQMLREIRLEYCLGYCKHLFLLRHKHRNCNDLQDYIKDLFAEAESQTEPENKDAN